MLTCPPKILVVSPSWLGDTVIAQSLLKILKTRTPTPRIDVLAPTWVHSLLQRIPEVDKLIELTIPHKALRLLRRYHLARLLSKEGYAQAIVLPNSFKSALIPFWAGISRRTGWLGEMRWGILNDVRVLDKKQYPSLVEQYAVLAFDKEATMEKRKKIADLPPSLEVLPQRVNRTLERLGLSVNESPIIALCPGASFGPAKRWPARHFASLALHYLRLGWRVWILGAHEDRSLACEINGASKGACCDLTGKTTVAETVDLLSQVTAVVTNDSGLMHIAAALGRPVVAVFGSSDLTYTPPLGVHAESVSLKLSCSPCFKKVCPLGHFNCLNQLPPSIVLKALDKVMAGRECYASVVD
ncbi:MAG: lipopolysaccharide heptosyltransferase II [Gammaproteobacteria bacterium]|nr:lipopolysaccharide heptosyltransferase II [Gammaproteobacteria bacterium]